MNIFAQVMGVFAIITWVMSIILKNKKDIILSQVVAFVGIIGNMLEIIAGIGALIKYHK